MSEPMSLLRIGRWARDIALGYDLTAVHRRVVQAVVDAMCDPDNDMGSEIFRWVAAERERRAKG